MRGCFKMLLANIRLYLIFWYVTIYYVGVIIWLGLDSSGHKLLRRLIWKEDKQKTEVCSRLLEDLEGSRRQRGIKDLQTFRGRHPASLGSISSNLDCHVGPNSCLCTISKILRDENIRHYLLSLGEGKDILNSEWADLYCLI